ncbi:MAG: hypothetical protein AB1489_04720 [Acidobacteriota bacterium]
MKRLKQTILLVFIGIVLILSVSEHAGSAAFEPAPPQKPFAPKPTTPSAAPTATGTVRQYNTKYDHFTSDKAKEAHINLTNQERCDLCHRNIDAFIKPARIEEPLPYHDSCVQCHSEQFTSVKLEICIGCHNRPYNQNPPVLPFTKQLNQFGMEFSHATHSARPNPVGNQKQEWDCAVCHNYYSDNKTARVTYPDHPECNKCHTAENKPAKGDCNECHNQTAQAQKFRNRGQIDIAYDYFKFNHGIHLASSKIDGRCIDCHDVIKTDGQPGASDASRIRLVLTSNPNLVHKSQCFKCHIPNPFGSGKQCEKCHVQPVGSLAKNPPKGYKAP